MTDKTPAQVAEDARREVDEAIGDFGCRSRDEGKHAEKRARARGLVRALVAAERKDAAMEQDGWWRASLEKWARARLRGEPATKAISYTGEFGGTPSMIVDAILAESNKIDRYAIDRAIAARAVEVAEGAHFKPGCRCHTARSWGCEAIPCGMNDGSREDGHGDVYIDPDCQATRDRLRAELAALGEGKDGR